MMIPAAGAGGKVPDRGNAHREPCESVRPVRARRECVDVAFG